MRTGVGQPANIKEEGGVPFRNEGGENGMAVVSTLEVEMGKRSDSMKPEK